MKLPLAASANLGRRATAEDFGLGVGERAIGDALNSASLITERLLEEEGKAQVSDRLSSAISEMSVYEANLQNDPDFHTHSARYADEQKKIIDRHAQSLSIPGFGGDFKRRIALSAQNGRNSVGANVRRKLIDSGRALYTHSMKSNTNNAARARSFEERRIFLENANEDNDGMKNSGFIDAVKHGENRQWIVDTILEGDFNELMLTDPREAVRSIRDPNSVWMSLDEPTRQELQKKAVAAWHSGIARQDRADDRARDAQERADKAMGRENYLNGMDMLRKIEGTTDSAERDVLIEEMNVWLDTAPVHNTLSATHNVYFEGRLDAGGGVSPSISPATKRQHLIDITNSIRRRHLNDDGTPIEKEIDELQLRGTLNATEAGAFKKAASDQRFGPHEARLRSRLDIPEAMAFSSWSKGDLRALASDAIYDFTIWMAEHDTASDPEIREYVEYLMGRASKDAVAVSRWELQQLGVYRTAEKGGMDVAATWVAASELASDTPLERMAEIGAFIKAVAAFQAEEAAPTSQSQTVPQQPGSKAAQERLRKNP